MFTPDMLKEKECKVTITDLDVCTVQALLKYMYSREVEPNFSSSLLIAADKYDLPALKDLCQYNLTKGLDKDNVVDVLLLADQHKAQGLKDVAMKYIVDQHMIQEMNVERMKSNPDLLALVLEAVLKAHPS